MNVDELVKLTQEALAAGELSNTEVALVAIGLGVVRCAEALEAIRDAVQGIGEDTSAIAARMPAS